MQKSYTRSPKAPNGRINAPLPKDLQRILSGCLRLDTSKRPSSVEELSRQLLECESSTHWNQQDAALWWREIFDGPYLDELEFDKERPSPDGTKGDTAV